MKNGKWGCPHVFTDERDTGPNEGGVDTADPC